MSGQGFAGAKGGGSPAHAPPPSWDSRGGIGLQVPSSLMKLCLAKKNIMRQPPIGIKLVAKRGGKSKELLNCSPNNFIVFST